MAKEITDVPAAYCFPGCPYMQLELEISITFADDRPDYVNNSVRCVHEEPCKIWAQQICKSACGTNGSCGQKGLVNPFYCELSTFNEVLK